MRRQLRSSAAFGRSGRRRRATAGLPALTGWGLGGGDRVCRDHVAGPGTGSVWDPVMKEMIVGQLFCTKNAVVSHAPCSCLSSSSSSSPGAAAALHWQRRSDQRPLHLHRDALRLPRPPARSRPRTSRPPAIWAGPAERGPCPPPAPRAGLGMNSGVGFESAMSPFPRYSVCSASA